MEEVGIDMSVHTPHTMDELVASNFDIIVTLADDAKKAVADRGLEAASHGTLVAAPIHPRWKAVANVVLGAYRELRDTMDIKLRTALEPMLDKGWKKRLNQGLSIICVCV